ncbi:S9 family peptidase [Aliikangiella marina]|uniref:S9 family peptidase n=1 Tax=Aliikangiella marina TaxID=1712262 RepID=A0A545T532_9GAMM|nr:S9 family peptidase [Aliikangiella marina]TQV72334.1 S9 family peptidase [Aliikangiella marina]
MNPINQLKSHHYSRGSLLIALSALLLSFVVTTSTQAKKLPGLSPDDYFDFKFVADPQISPDASKILFVKRQVSEDGRKRHASLWMIEGNSEPRPFTFGNNDSNPKWSPDGKQITFTRKKDKQTQIWMMPASGGEPNVATDIEDVLLDYEWLPDNSGFILTLESDPEKTHKENTKKNNKAADKKSKRAKPDIIEVKHALYQSNSIGFLDEKRSHIWTFDLSTKKLTRLTSGKDWNDNHARLSSDGKFIYFDSNRTGEEYDGSENSDIWRVATKGGNPQKITDHAHRDSSPTPSPDGRLIAYYHAEDTYEQTDLWVMDADGKNKKNLTEKFDRQPQSIIWSPDGQLIYFIAADHGATRLFKVDIASKEVSKVFEKNMSVSNLAVAANHRFLVFSLEDATQLAELYQFDLSSKKLKKITSFNDSLLKNRQLTTLEEFWFTNDKGMRVQGFYQKPINFKKGKKYPLVLNIKGGPGGMWGHRWFQENQMYAAKGYAVAFVNYRGSSGYGIEHAKAVRLDYGGADYQDNIQFLDKLLAEKKWLNANKLYLTGGSHGGFLTNWITTKTDRFKAAVTQRSVSSWISEAGTQEFTPRAMRKEFGGNLWENFDYYWNRSPLQFANQVKTPTLIIHSDKDLITPLGQGQEWFYALKNNNVDTEMVIFKNETHSLSRSGKPINLVERIKRIIEWFERYQ